MQVDGHALHEHNSYVSRGSRTVKLCRCIKINKVFTHQIKGEYISQGGIEVEFAKIQKVSKGI